MSPLAIRSSLGFCSVIYCFSLFGHENDVEPDGAEYSRHVSQLTVYENSNIIIITGHARFRRLCLSALATDHHMNAQPKEIRIRLLLSIGCVVILASVYVRALAVATVSGTFSSMVRPWQNVVTDLFLFCLSAVALVCLTPVVRRGTRNQKILGILLAMVPFLVVGHFIVWLLLSYENWGG